MTVEDPAVIEPDATTADAGATEPKRRRWPSGSGWKLFNRYGLVFAFIALAVLFSALKPDAFPTSRNLQTILTQNASLTLMALGVMLPLIVNRFDLSPGYMGTMAG